MRILALLLFVLIAPSLNAAEPAKPGLLTPQEIAEGWLALFDGETTFGWTVKGEAAVKDGVLIVGGEKPGSIASTSAFTHFELRVEASGIKGGSVSLSTSQGAVFSGFALSTTSQHFVVQPGAKLLMERAPGDSVASTKNLVTADGPVTIHLSSVKVKSVKLRPLGFKPIFNGKDLTGWKVFDGDAGKRKLASKFSVTPKGELHVADGPGDLQTVGKYADFCLQFDCQTNGKFLNSGIFFRCLPDQYQNGYEAQIQNGYLIDRAKPIDFGTGAIYRRVPARKVVSNDNEWFTMTVLAQGKHIATWVNGYQTVDWTDERPANDNPRQGSKTGAGHLSIQGHDPTTDILFRNLKVLDMAPAK